MGATIAQAAGLTAPIAVSSAPMPNIIQGMSAIRPPTTRTARCTSQSVVPLARAMAKRYVTPTSTTNRSPGNPAKMSSSERPPTSLPTRKAAAKASTPILIDSSVATAKAIASTAMDTNSGDILPP